MGATRKSIYHHLFQPVATQHISWEVLFTHGNELLRDPQEPSHVQNDSWDFFFYFLILIFNF